MVPTLPRTRNSSTERSSASRLPRSTTRRIPWKALPDVEPDHRKVIEKLVSWAPEHRNEVAAYLHKAVFLVGQTKQPRLSLVRSPETPS